MSVNVENLTAHQSYSIKKFRVALVGNPNTGKTSVFNALTGLRQKVGNYPGVTVEKKSGMLISPGGAKVEVIDLPGLYSLNPQSLDEEIAVETLYSDDAIDLIVVVADASNLNRNLYLVSQLLELNKPTLLALNMVDVAKAHGIEINIDELAASLAVTVIPVIGSKGEGIPELRRTIFDILESTDSKKVSPPQWLKDPALETFYQPFIGEIAENTELTNLEARLRLQRIFREVKTFRENAASSNGKLSTADYPKLNSVIYDKYDEWQQLEAKVRYRWVDSICDKIICRLDEEKRSFSDKIDQVLTHHIAGPIVFLLLFSVVFQSIFTWAEAPMDAIETGVGWLGELVANLLPAGALQSLIVDGAIGGVGSILVFLPQILFLFFFLSLLEDSGYMTRVAFMMDRFMRGAGLSGRSIIPLLSSFACAIPGIMATRTIRNWQERLITIMIAPLMSCSARLPVYTLMIGAFIPNQRIAGVFSLAGFTLLAMYLLGVVAAIVAALVFKKFLIRGRSPASFMMELPPYRLPSLRWTLLQMWERAKIFVTDAGKIILAMSLVLWFLSSYPKTDAGTEATAGEQIRQSYAGQIGQIIEPVIEPLGFDWKLGIGLITSFAAREVLVSTLATIYNVESGDENSLSLRDALRNETDPVTGKPRYTPLVAISLMVFFVLACQCMSTVAIVKRETNSWRWPIIMIVYMTALAYIGSLVVYQGGLLLGLG
ncbi:MAG: ferrous iron transport protein B [Calditrichia bacterium]